MRNESLFTNLRPIISTDKVTTNEIEKFQNEVLRPILKLQHMLLEILIENNLLIGKLLKDETSAEIKRFKIKGVLSKSEVKYQLIGQITGLLTNSEYKFYCINKKEIDKRIFSMILDRMLSVECI